MKSRTCALVLVIVLSAAVLSAQTLTLTPADIAYSIFMQFSGATDASGTPIYRTGTTSGLAVNLEECSGCGVSGWGWRDERWGRR